ncbi:MAG: sulfite exporter TauE/SafE family protein [Paracoccaceae bacterium]
MIDPATLLIVAVTFLLAGIVKGVIGLGLPTISLALLTATLGLQPAMALMLAPSFATNMWQAVTGGHGRAILSRLWPFMATATVTVWIGAALSAPVDVALLSALLGVLLVIYAATGLGRARLSLPPGSERWAGPLTGCVNGVLTGMTGSFVVPGVPYLQALGLPRDMLIQAMGMLFTLSTAALGLALAGRALLSADLGLQSVAAIAPALLGMVLGRRLRHRLSEARFRMVFFAALLVLGLYIVALSPG